MTRPLTPALTYTGKTWLKAILVSAIVTTILLRFYVPKEAVDDDLPLPILCVLLFVIQLIGAVIPALLFNWLLNVVVQKTTSATSKKWTLWLAAIAMLVVFCGAYLLFTGEASPQVSHAIKGVDDLLVFCVAGNLVGLSIFIWWHKLPAQPVAIEN